MTRDLTAIVDFFFEAGQLKRTPRTGWSLARIANSESVADHSFRTALIAMTMAAMIGADAETAAAIALLHDLPETRVGDINHLARRFVDARPADELVESQLSGLPEPVSSTLRSLARLWHEQANLEAQLASDADVIEAILHIRESLHDRRDLEDEWIDYLAPAVQTDIGRSILDCVRDRAPDRWWIHAVKRG